MIRSGLSALLAALFLVPSASAQIPDEFTNLRLLDKEIGKRQLVRIMRDWAGGLGVRCAHCHVGPDDLEGMDFASDEKATKRTARRMLEMSRVLNDEMLAGLPTVQEDGREQSVVISCYSCHRGMARPPRLAVEELIDAGREGGSDAALARFHELEEEHGEAGRYDLTSKTLNQLAEAFAIGKQYDAARSTLQFQIERDPGVVNTWFMLGRVERWAGNLEEAKAAFKRVLALEPDNLWARDMIQKIDSEAASSEGS